MDLKTLLDDLLEEASCSVCMKTFFEPKVLPCLHSFCLPCLKEIFRTCGSHDIRCPECRGEVPVPSTGYLEDLPTNFRIKHLLDVLEIKDCHTAGVKCGNCDKSSTRSSYCFQCCAFWCDMCIIAHNKIKANKEHRVLPLKGFENQNIEEALKQPAFCQQRHHENEELKLFCENCDVAICQKCVATTHDGHAKILLEEASERKIQVKSVIETKKENIEQKKDEISDLEIKSHHIEVRGDAVNRDIRKFAENVSEVIETKKKETLNKVETQIKECLGCVRTQQCEVNQPLETAEITQLHKSPNMVLAEEVRDVGKQAASDHEGLRQFRFKPNETLLDSLNSDGIGSFETFVTNTCAHQSTAEGKGLSEASVGLESNFLLTTRNAEGEQYYNKRDCVSVEIKNQQGHDCAREVRFKDEKDGRYKVRYFLKDTGECQVSVKVNEEHIHGSPFPVKPKPRQFRHVLSFGQPGSSVGMLNGPYGVAVNERDEIAVTEIGNHRVQVFSSDGTYLRSLSKKGNKEGEFNWPSGIAFDKNSCSVVADSSDPQVQFFDEQGEYLSQFSDKGHLNFQLRGPFGLFVDRNGNIIVADEYNKLIKTFYPNGKCLSKLGEGEGEGFTCPFHCIQYEKYLIVSDRGECCIKVFDINGNFLCKFGNMGKRDGEFNEPRFLSVNKAGHLMVCDAENDRVQVFKLDGMFVTKFGNFGMEPGEFQHPTSAAVLSDGKIVVADCFNNRIQIFE